MAKQEKNEEKKIETKSKVKKETKKEIKPEIKEEVETTVYETNCDKACEETNPLNKIFWCLVVIIVLLIVNIITNVILTTNIKSTSSNEAAQGNKKNDEEIEYNVSNFREVNADEFVEEFKKDEYHLFYLGRPTCGYCVKFVPVLNAVQDLYDFKTLYFDISKYGEEDANKIINLNESFFTGDNTSYGYTPMMLIVKNGEIVDHQVGYSDQSTFEELVSKYFKKKQ